MSFIEVKGGQWKEFSYLEGFDGYSLGFLSKLTWKEFEKLKEKLSDTQINVDSIESVYEVLKNFLVQREVAKIMNKKFILVHFNKLPVSLGIWLEKENIKYIEYSNK